VFFGFFFVGVFCMLSIASIPALAKDAMRLVYSDGFAPYSWRDNNQMKGILVDVMTEALGRRMKVRLTHQGFPWKRAQALVKNNRADAFVTVPTPTRATFTAISKEAVVAATYQIYVKAGNPRIPKLLKVKNAKDLKPFSLGNYLGNGWARKSLAGMHVHWADKIADSLRMLVRDRFDVFAGNSHVANYQIKKLGLTGQVIELPVVLDVNTFNLCVRKNSVFVHLLDEFDQTIAQMRKEGVLTDIYARYR
jgi:polar amino acid transport system substrate-binding protein